MKLSHLCVTSPYIFSTLSLVRRLRSITSPEYDVETVVKTMLINFTSIGGSHFEFIYRITLFKENPSGKATVSPSESIV